MLSHLSLSLCLISVSVQPPTPGMEAAPAAVPAPLNAAPAHLGSPAGNYGTGNFGPAPAMNGYQGDYCPQCGHRHHKHTPFHDWTCPPCNLSQRYPYYPTDHGHYYFRPYHMQRVLEHQAIAVTWGEDPRNPYGQLVFERVYDQIRAEQAAKAETLPMPMGTPMPMAVPMPMPPQEGKTPLPTPPVPKPEPENDPMLPKPAPPAPAEGEAPKSEPSAARRPINILRK